MDLEFIFNGPPKHFTHAAMVFSQKHLMDKTECHWTRSGTDPNANVIFLMIRNIYNLEIFVGTQHLHKSRTLLLVHFPDEKWEEYRIYWDLLHEELIRQGWMDNQPTKEVDESDKSDDKSRNEEKYNRTVPLNSNASVSPSIPPSSIKPIQPWERIRDHYWDREALKFWLDGWTCRDIGDRIGISPRRVTNRISELRGIYGTEIVPKNEERRKILIRKKS